ncbi:SDR family NAD(P)-dependent oxidoreductase [Pararoseomonas indoligenes]|uniref:SDR family oxidoreductase n=1 Tax=Roseomonas indoligenes TaxID=2820811 RepID=A0A940S6Z0_9PROT|nr:SDR family oxidoreductase [Pararoseomonas indoligenes]MBP0496061.1 SDR family oxidoreductase [Pararoseomonas indoligenes]
MTSIAISAPPRMDGRVAVVTGGAGGIGRAVCAALAEAGAKVVAADLHAPAHALAPGVTFAQCDVTSRAGTEAMIDAVLAEHGRIDALILCAGTIANTPLQDSEDDEWRSILDVNLMGVVNPLRKLYPIMVEAGGGKIVALGSIAAKIGGVASGPAYVSAKSAVHGLMKWVAKSGAQHGIFANTIAPGPVETPMWQTVTGRAPPSANGSVPLGRFGQPEDIAQAILFLCSPASNWITGTVLDVNGGMLMD